MRLHKNGFATNGSAFSRFTSPIASRSLSSGNVQAGRSRITAALLQYYGTPRGDGCATGADCHGSDYCEQGACVRDGHFVTFNDAAAKRQLDRFLATTARDG